MSKRNGKHKHLRECKRCYKLFTTQLKFNVICPNCIKYNKRGNKNLILRGAKMKIKKTNFENLEDIKCKLHKQKFNFSVCKNNCKYYNGKCELGYLK